MKIARRPVLIPFAELSPRMRLLRVATYFAFCVFMSSLLASGAVETIALSQPTTATGHFTHPRDIKGITKFLTDYQYKVDNIAHALLGSSGVVAVLLVLIEVHYHNEIDRENDPS
jgi:hypothetical protein